MTKRNSLTVLCFVAVLAAAIVLFHQRPVRAQQTPRLQIASFSVGADQTLTYPAVPPSPYLTFFPDEHTTFFPPASSSSPYLIFGASGISGSPMGHAVALESTDLRTFKFATDRGYKYLVMTISVAQGSCNPAYDTEFDEGYAAPGSVLQDPTLPAGNLMMLYEAENHCPGGVHQAPFYATTGFARSSDNGKTWPPPANGVLGGPNRYPVLQSSTPPPSVAHEALGDALPSGFVDKSADGHYYLYATYRNFPSGREAMVARAKVL